MMDFLLRAAGSVCKLGILPGSFNPLTVAHLALAEAALRNVDEVVFVLPQVFPHKPYSGASFDQRLSMLQSAVSHNPRLSVAASQGGLFVDIARECREAYGAGVGLSFLCGRDAAERIAGWDYGRPDAFLEMLREFDFLVAARAGEYQPPRALAGSFTSLELDGPFDHVSSSEVRSRIGRGEPWRHLVPESITGLVGEIYTQRKNRQPCAEPL